MEGDGLRLLMSFKQADVREVLESFVTKITEGFSSYAAHYKRGFEKAKLKVVCELGEVLEKGIKVNEEQVVKDLSGPVDTKIQEMMKDSNRKENVIIIGPMLKKLML